MVFLLFIIRSTTPSFSSRSRCVLAVEYATIAFAATSMMLRHSFPIVFLIA
jgi:hypothetical protein